MPKSFTKEGLAKLKAELDQLKNVERRKLAQEMNKAAGFGDLSENAAYKDAKEKRAFMEGRILDLEKMLVNAKVLEKKSSSQIEIGSCVSIQCDDVKQQFMIVSPEETDFDKGYISCESPIGKAILGKTQGDEIEIQTPSGAIARYYILKVN